MPSGTSVVRCNLRRSPRRSHSLQLLKVEQVLHKRGLTAFLHFIPSAPCVPSDPHPLLLSHPPSSKTAHLQLCCPTFPFAILPCKRPPLSSLTLSSFLMSGLLCSQSFTCHTLFYIFLLGIRFLHVLEPSCCLFHLTTPLKLLIDLMYLPWKKSGNSEVGENNLWTTLSLAWLRW